LSGDFFDEPAEQSLLKANIVADYFVAWARIISKHAERIGYFDFYAGPGRYEGGQKSTPLLILERTIENPDLASRLVSRFNDKNPEYTKSLASEIHALPGIEKLRHKPRVITGEVDDHLVRQFSEIRTLPAISFVDPWGYKGLSQDLIQAVVKDWACEVIFFFNHNRINAAIENPKAEKSMQALFGVQRLETLRRKATGLDSKSRERVVHDAIKDALTDKSASRYPLAFRFRRADGRLSHSIWFVSKDPLGYGIMKDIMAKRGLVDHDGVPRFEHIPQAAGIQLPLGEERPIQSLMNELLVRFVGGSLTVKAIFDKHNVGTDFIMPNYKEALRRLEAQGRVTCSRDAAHRRKGSLADDIVISFPPLP
jgi:three-Cys-motif partner protein